MTDYTPQNFVKGDAVRVARSPRQAVALRFDGFLPEAYAAPVDAPADVTEVEVKVPETPVAPKAPKPAPPTNPKD